VEDRLPRKLAVILYADVAGYSRLTGDDEDATHRALSKYLDLISNSIESQLLLELLLRLQFIRLCGKVGY